MGDPDSSWLLTSDPPAAVGMCSLTLYLKQKLVLISKIVLTNPLLVIFFFMRRILAH